jgi:hypothetical protein
MNDTSQLSTPIKARPHPYINTTFSELQTFIALWPKLYEDLCTLYQNGRILQVRTPYSIIIIPVDLLIRAFAQEQLCFKTKFISQHIQSEYPPTVLFG